MKIMEDIKESNALLKQYKGGKVDIIAYTNSLRRILLRLSHRDNNVDEVVYLAGVSCESISGEFSWNNSNVVIKLEEVQNDYEYITSIIDENSGFKLVTSGGFALCFGKEEEFGEPFEDFLKKS